MYKYVYIYIYVHLDSASILASESLKSRIPIPLDP